MGPSPAALAPPTPKTRLGWIEHDLRRVAAVVSAGFVLGLVINGVGSRLAMMLLARLNPDVTGRLSDDGFVMGHFRLDDTVGLVALGAVFGVLGGLVYLTVEGLRIGPKWFQMASITVGPAVVIGASLVHSDGIDFVVLRPLWLTVGLFVLLPALFAGAMRSVADRWLAEGSWFMNGSRWRLLTLAPGLMMIPISPALAVGAAARATYLRAPALRRGLPPPRLRTIGRVALTVLFVVALADLVGDVATLRGTAG